MCCDHLVGYPVGDSIATDSHHELWPDTVAGRADRRERVTLSANGFGESVNAGYHGGPDQIVHDWGALMSITEHFGLVMTNLAIAVLAVLRVLVALVNQASIESVKRVRTPRYSWPRELQAFEAIAVPFAGDTRGPPGQRHPTVTIAGTLAVSDGPLVIAVRKDATWRCFAPSIATVDDPLRDHQRPSARPNRVSRSGMNRALASRGCRGFGHVRGFGDSFWAVRDLVTLHVGPPARDQRRVRTDDQSNLGRLEVPRSCLVLNRSPSARACRRKCCPRTGRWLRPVCWRVPSASLTVADEGSDAHD
jgi:hypothetical protein